LRSDHRQNQRLLPVVDAAGRLCGVLTRGDIREYREKEGDAVLAQTLGALARSDTVAAHPDETLRMVVYRMADKGVTRLPVVERDTGRFLGLISLDDLLKARTRHLEEEQRREQPLKVRFLLPGGRADTKTETTAASGGLQVELEAAAAAAPETATGKTAAATPAAKSGAA
jgi:CIC family chloride channel protein